MSTIYISCSLFHSQVQILVSAIILFRKLQQQGWAFLALVRLFLVNVQLFLEGLKASCVVRLHLPCLRKSAGAALCCRDRGNCNWALGSNLKNEANSEYNWGYV